MGNKKRKIKFGRNNNRNFNQNPQQFNNQYNQQFNPNQDQHYPYQQQNQYQPNPYQQNYNPNMNQQNPNQMPPQGRKRIANSNVVSSRDAAAEVFAWARNSQMLAFVLLISNFIVLGSMWVYLDIIAMPVVVVVSVIAALTLRKSIGTIRYLGTKYQFRFGRLDRFIMNQQRMNRGNPQQFYGNPNPYQNPQQYNPYQPNPYQPNPNQPNPNPQNPNQFTPNNFQQEITNQPNKNFPQQSTTGQPNQNFPRENKTDQSNDLPFWKPEANEKDDFLNEIKNDVDSNRGKVNY